MPDDDEQTADHPVEDVAQDEPGQDAEPEVKAAADGPGAWTALAAPGKPDGEVDTRS
jgi:hypothetical protein